MEKRGPESYRPKLKREEQRRETTVADRTIGENKPLAQEPEELRTNSCSRGKAKMTQLTKGVVPGINFPEEGPARAWLESSRFRVSELVGYRTVFEHAIAAPRRHFYSGLLSVSRGKSKPHAEGAVRDRLSCTSKFLLRGTLSRNSVGRLCSQGMREQMRNDEGSPERSLLPSMRTENRELLLMDARALFLSPG